MKRLGKVIKIINLHQHRQPNGLEKILTHQLLQNDVGILTINSSFRPNDRGIYQDLLRHFRNQGHTVFIAKIGTADESDVENVDEVPRC